MTSKERNALALVSKARVDLAAATTVEQVVSIHKTCEIARSLARAAKLGLEAQNAAAEMKIRAERKLGQFLAELNLRGGKQGENGKERIRLNDIGISQHQSKRWQKIARVPEDSFSDYVALANQASEEISSAAVRRLADKISHENQCCSKRNGNARSNGATSSPKKYDHSESSNQKESRFVLDEMEQHLDVLCRLIDEVIENEPCKRRKLFEKYTSEIVDQLSTLKESLISESNGDP